MKVGELREQLKECSDNYKLELWYNIFEEVFVNVLDEKGECVKTIHLED